MPFQCRCGCSDFLVAGETFKLVKRTFLWMSWLAKVPSHRYLVACSRENCRLPMVVSLHGIHETPPTPDRSRREPEKQDPELDEFIGSEMFEALPAGVRNAIKRGSTTTPRPLRSPLADAVRRPEV